MEIVALSMEGKAKVQRRTDGCHASQHANEKQHELKSWL